VKTKMPYAQALEIAQGFVAAIRPYCERVEIAGSLRRQKEEIGDIEVVAIPKIVMGLDLFGNAGVAHSLLEEGTRSFNLLLDGPFQKKIQFAFIDVDLFITTPEKFGVIFAIRTGSADFSKWLVTTKQKGGALPSNMRVHDGRVWMGQHALVTPEEVDFFKAIGLTWVHPEQRAEGRWRK
jgi:DNA polymerase/3'-5' exonuclease PolX